MKSEILGVKAPEKKEGENDQNCPFHGILNVKDETFVGTVVNRDAHGTLTLKWERLVFNSKYERQLKKTNTLRAHNPPCIAAEVGQKVLVVRTRPISKTKHHVVLKVFKDSEDLKKAVKK